MKTLEFPKIIAHRGHLTDLHENAVSSIKKVLKLSPDYIEIDIGVTKDNKIILLHDPDLERTTNGRGCIRDKTLKEIKELRLKNYEGKVTPESLPALAEVMEIMRKQSTDLQIDAKYYDSDIIVEALLQRINNNDIEKTITTSTNLKFLKKVRKSDPNIRLGYDPQDMYDAELINNLKNMYTTYTDFSPITFEEMGDEFLSQIISRSKEINAEAIYLDNRLILRRQKELNLIEIFHENGIEVAVWTVNKKEEMQLLINLGVDRITTDRTDLLIQLRENVS
jgi:glycerophosphoryl diester phosphodiesterase